MSVYVYLRDRDIKDFIHHPEATDAKYRKGKLRVYSGKTIEAEYPEADVMVAYLGLYYVEKKPVQASIPYFHPM